MGCIDFAGSGIRVCYGLEIRNNRFGDKNRITDGKIYLKLIGPSDVNTWGFALGGWELLNNQKSPHLYHGFASGVGVWKGRGLSLKQQHYPTNQVFPESQTENYKMRKYGQGIPPSYDLLCPTEILSKRKHKHKHKL